MQKKLEDPQIAVCRPGSRRAQGPIEQVPGPIPRELNEFAELPRLIVPFNRTPTAGCGSSSII